MKAKAKAIMTQLIMNLTRGLFPYSNWSYTFSWIYTESHFSYCTAEIINISEHKAVDQHSELKKWVLENRVSNITDKEKDTIDNYVLDVFEVHVLTVVSLQSYDYNNVYFLSQSFITSSVM